MSEPCSSCDSPLACVECSKVVIGLRLEVRKLRRELEAKPAPGGGGDEELERLRQEVRELRIGLAEAPSWCELESAIKKVPKDAREAHAKMQDLDRKIEDLKKAAQRIHPKIRGSIREIVARKLALKGGPVYDLCEEIESFFSDHLGIS